VITATVDIHAARECAKGTKQAAVVEELLLGPIPVNLERIYSNFTAAFYGTARLPWKSWLGLQERLRTAGFVLEKTRMSDTESRIELVGRKW
jgi:hypothetical protein